MTNIYDPEPHTLPLLRACEAAPEMAPFFGVNLAYLPQIGTVARTAPKRPRSSKGVPKSQYNPSMKDRALALMREGVEWHEVAEQTGVALSTLKLWYRDSDIDMDTRPVRYSRETKLKAIARTDAGESLAEVSERMGIPINTIKTWRRSRGTR